MAQSDLPYAKRSLIESLPLIPLQVDCRPKIARGQGVKSGAGVLIAEFEAGCV
jgi:hypothetical protein